MSKPLFPDIVVNGTTLSAADIAAEAQNHHAPKGKPGLAWRKAARALAVRQLMLEQATERGLAATPRELAPGQVETQEESLIRALMEQEISPEPVSETALLAAYDANRTAYRAPSLFQAAHILFAAEPGNKPARNAARERAEATLALLQKTPGEFAAVAGRESECASRDMGGELGQLTGSDVVPEFAAVLQVAVPGQVHNKVVETRFGMHVLRLDARAEGDILPFESARPRLLEAAEKVAWTRAAQSFVAGLLDKADITGMDMNIAA
jgi:peptidyl-prolyl cis-trans isomerase C